MQNLWQDLRYGARMLLKSPNYTLIASLTLALGIGANTAIFTVINAALLRPLPYEDAERLVVVAATMRRDTVEVRSTSYPDFLDWRDQNTVFERLAARTSASFTLTGGANPERVNGELVSADYFPLLRARAALGRTFLPEEDRAPDMHRVALVGSALWRRRFGGSPAMIGQTIQLNDGNYTVVGVMPDGFRGVSDDAEIWLPMMMVSSVRPTHYLQQRDQRWHSTVGRLKPGVTLAQAQTEMDAIARRIEQTYPDSNRNRGARVTLLHERFFGGLQLMLWVLLGAVVCVLLVACANVANLQLQRAAGRASEMAVRLALGATPRRLIRQLLTESLLLALTLLIGAGLMIRSLQRLQAVDPGFNSERLLTMWVSLPLQRYRRDQMAAFSQQLREALRALPGAQSVALASDLPLSGSTSAGPIELEGRPATSADGEIRMYRHRVTPGFFSTLGIPLIKGRDFTAGDHAQAPGVVIISEAMARRYWPNEDPIGKRLKETNQGDPWLSIVGVAGEVKYRGLPQNPNSDPDVYFPVMQAPVRDLNLAVRASVDPDSLVPAVRDALQKLDPDLPAYGVTTMAQVVANNTAQSRFSAWILGIFGALALVLAAVGIYSVMAYAVEQRSREIGVRVALGARAGDVLKMVIGRGMRLALLGVALGLGAALALTQLMKRLLFGVAAADPLTYGALALLLTLIALFACWIPARRATKVDPMIALRCE